MSKFNKQSIEVGEAFQLTGAHDRQQQIERTLERLKLERIKQAEIECQQMFDNARQEAHEIMQLARQKAETIIKEGETQVETVLKKGYTEGETAGFEKGHKVGLHQAEQETLHLLESAQLLLNGAYTAQEKILIGFKTQAMGLTTYITQKVLQRELSESPETLLTLFDAAIENLNLTGRIKVLVSIDTFKTLTEYNTTTQQALEKLSRYHLEADPLLDTHEIFVLADEGNFVLSPENQGQSLLKSVEKHLELPEVTAEEINNEFENLPEATLIEPSSSETSDSSKASENEPPAPKGG